MVCDDDEYQADDIANGYFHLLDNAIHQQASSRSRNIGRWDFRPHVIGFLLALNCPDPHLTWGCIEFEGVVEF